MGTVVLVFYVFPYLGIIFAPLLVLYVIVATYYRRTSVETKRMDSLLRSALYASYSGPSLAYFQPMVLMYLFLAETLTGLATIRAYGEQVSVSRPFPDFSATNPSLGSSYSRC
jgi:ATP-binding cassette, subfamily C (CFTR/MRP), member 1